jgi:hypothetical protein
MTTQITNNGASIKIDNGTAIRNIMKSQIIEIVIVKTNILKIDIGKGALYNLFIPFADVTVPATANPETLKDAINTMLSTAASGGTATEEKQLIEIEKLNALNATADTIKNAVNTLDSKIFFEPVMVDESNPNLIYKGFASPAASTDAPVWAIQRISISNEIASYQWARGAKNFDNIWNNRATLSYS